MDVVFGFWMILVVLPQLCSSAAPGTISFVTTQVEVRENDLKVELTIQRTGGSDGDVVFICKILNSTDDFVANEAQDTFKAGLTGTKACNFYVNDDAIPEGNETFLVQLSLPGSSASLGDPNQSIIKIIANDGAYGVFGFKMPGDIIFHEPRTNGTNPDVPCPEWFAGEWSECSKTCGRGIQNRKVTCKNSNIGKCLSNRKPDERKLCNKMPCPKWSLGTWGKCSKSCGGGVKTRKVLCSGSGVAPCGGQKPPPHQTCSPEPCPKWVVTPWSKCASKKCGVGKKSRHVTCTGKSKRSCKRKDKPATRISCAVECPKWRTADWSKCEGTCQSSRFVRRVWCEGGNRKCKWKKKPTETNPCLIAGCATWTVGAWGPCPASCGGSIRSRSVRCVNKESGKSLQACNKTVKPEKLQACSLTECPYDKDPVKDDSHFICRQEMKDQYFCSLLLKDSLRQLCQFKKWAKKCCNDCSKVETLTKNTR